MISSKSLTKIMSVLVVSSLFVSLSMGLLQTTPVQAQTATTWYVTTSGNDANTCSDSGTPCLTINGALSQAVADDIIEIATGTYTGSGTDVVLIDKGITLSGGWDVGFTVQSGLTTIDGQTTRRGIKTTGSPVIIDHFKIQNGVASDSSFGGGIHTSGDLTFNNGNINNNTASWMGGGIYVADGTLKVNNSTITGNTAGSGGSGGGGGAGIQNYSGEITINNSTISNNTIVGGFSGSGISNFQSMTLNNTTVSGNTGAAGIDINDGTVIIRNSTITNNDAGLENTFGDITLQNSIIAGNSYVNCNNNYGTITSTGYNLLGENCLLTDGPGDITGTYDSPINPLLGSLQDNGGPTFTHALLGGSPALNTGNPTTPGSTTDACLATDQRGTTRSTTRCDIGAYEMTGPMVESIKRVSASPISATSVDFTVIFTESVTGVDITDFALTTNLTGASVTSVSGAGAFYTVTVNAGSANGTVRLDLTDDDSITNGTSTPLGGIGIGNGDTTSGESYDIDTTVPTVLSILRYGNELTRYGSEQFVVTFSEAVNGVDTTDFALTGSVTNPSITNIASDDQIVYSITVNTGSGDGSLRLDVTDDDSITDTVSNPLAGAGTGNGDFTTGESYTIDKTQPKVLSLVRADADPTTASSVNFTLTFSEAVTNVTVDHFERETTGLGGTSITGISGSGTTYTVTVNTGTGTGTLHLDLMDVSPYIKDAAGNRLAEDPVTGMTDYFDGETYTINRPIDTSGPLDTTFGVNGFVTYHNGDGTANDFAVQPDGKIVVVGNTYFSYERLIVLWRYNADGSRDTTFGINHDGFVITPISNFSTADSVAIQADGKIVISAFTDFGVLLVRYTPNGTLDSTFGNGGKVTTQTDGFYTSIAIQPNGQIVLAGDDDATGTNRNFMIQRYNSNGSLDTSFGVKGKVITSFGNTADESQDVLLQPDGKIIVVGHNGYKGFAMARYNPNGTLDTGFGNAGKVLTTFTNEAVGRAVTLQPDGKIVVTGSMLNNNDTSTVAVARYNTNGTLDKTFSADGKLTTAIENSSGGAGVVVLPDGRIMIAGSSGDGTTGTFTLIQYKNNGTLDTTFGTGGFTKTAIADSSWAGGLALQPDGKLILAGNAYTNGNDYFAIARYNIGYSITPVIGVQSGWVLESSETSQKGGSTNHSAITMKLGDDTARKQYRGILSFATGENIPDNAIITSVTLKVKKQGVVGAGDPLTILQGFMTDIKKGFFGTLDALQASDFNASPSKVITPITSPVSGGWYRLNLTAGKAYINKLGTNGGLTQIRLRFKLDDNNDSLANILSLYSANGPVLNRPQLLITYYVP